MTRAEHLQWAKDRALEYYNAGDLSSAVASMASDLGKHAETEHAGQTMAPLAMMFLVSGDSDGVRRWIEGFN